MSYIEIGKTEGRLIAGGTGDSSKGFFVAPTVIADLDPKARVMQEEIFGPVVGIVESEETSRKRSKLQTTRNTV